MHVRSISSDSHKQMEVLSPDKNTRGHYCPQGAVVAFGIGGYDLSVTCMWCEPHLDRWFWKHGLSRPAKDG